MPVISFYISWKCQETSGFLMFSLGCRKRPVKSNRFMFFLSKEVRLVHTRGYEKGLCFFAWFDKKKGPNGNFRNQWRFHVTVFTKNSTNLILVLISCQSQLIICKANQWAGFCFIGSLVLDGLSENIPCLSFGIRNRKFHPWIFTKSLGATMPALSWRPCVATIFLELHQYYLCSIVF